MKHNVSQYAFSLSIAILLSTGIGSAQVTVPTQQAGTNFEAIALLKFYPAAQGSSFAVGNVPVSVVFDGSSIWVANDFGHSLTKLRASDGLNLGVFPTPGFAAALAFDGANIWVASPNLNSVTKLRARDGVQLGIFPVGLDPGGLAFDGTDIWVSNFGANTVTKLRASDGANQGTFSTGVVLRGWLSTGLTFGSPTRQTTPSPNCGLLMEPISALFLPA